MTGQCVTYWLHWDVTCQMVGCAFGSDGFGVRWHPGILLLLFGMQFLMHFVGYLLLEVSQTILIWLISEPDKWNG